MNIKKVILILAIMSMAFLSGCKKTPKQPNLGSNVDYQKIEQYPQWVIQPSYPNAIAGVGSSKISTLGFDFARKEAMTSARVDLASQIETKIENLFKSYKTKTGIGETSSVDAISENVAKELIDMNLKGATLRETWISPENELFVLMTIDNEKLKENTAKAINNSKNFPNPDIEVKMKSESAQSELKDEINSYFSDSNTPKDNSETPLKNNTEE